jgi:hypothetical protein
MANLVLRRLRKIDVGVTKIRIELQRALAGFDEEQEAQNARLEDHDTKLADHERRLRRLERISRR